MKTSTKTSRWTWQRVVAGFLAVGGALACVYLIVSGHVRTWNDAVQMLVALGGCLVFWRYALERSGKHDA